MPCTLDSKDIGNMQDAHLNSGTPIFKIRILAQFVSHDFFEITHFHAQNIFISNGKLILNTEINTPSARDSLLLAKVL